jgi:hypothetical protein
MTKYMPQKFGSSISQCTGTIFLELYVLVDKFNSLWSERDKGKRAGLFGEQRVLTLISLASGDGRRERKTEREREREREGKKKCNFEYQV